MNEGQAQGLRQRKVLGSKDMVLPPPFQRGQRRAFGFVSPAAKSWLIGSHPTSFSHTASQWLSAPCHKV